TRNRVHGSQFAVHGWRSLDSLVLVLVVVLVLEGCVVDYYVARSMRFVRVRSSLPVLICLQFRSVVRTKFVASGHVFPAFWASCFREKARQRQSPGESVAVFEQNQVSLAQRVSNCIPFTVFPRKDHKRQILTEPPHEICHKRLHCADKVLRR